MKMPNFLIIGAAKSGTTSLYHYLAQHPQIFMSRVKEPGFFAMEGRAPDYRGPGDLASCRLGTPDLQSYCALFDGVRDEKAVGEASTAYLYLPPSAASIHRCAPEMKLIAVLRNPVERAYSNFLHMVRDGREPHRDFARALDAEAGRIRDNWHLLWHYRQVGFYAAQLKPYFALFGRERVKVYLHEDLTRADWLVRDIFEFLGVDDGFMPDLSERLNVSGVPRSRMLHNFINKPYPLKLAFKRLLPRQWRGRFSARLYKRNLARPPLPGQVRAQLIEAYRDDITQLQEMLGRDLSSWLKASRS